MNPIKASSIASRPVSPISPTIAVLVLIAMVVPRIGNAQVIAGTAEPDELTGTVGDDTINGRGGADLMIGLTGDDTYIVNDEADEVVEQVVEGTDTIRTFVSYVLPAYVENLVLEGTQVLNGMGNNLANRIIGNSGDNFLGGGLGNDTLTGRAGHDGFLFSRTPNSKSNVDRLTDFDVAEDRIWLSWPAFPFPHRGALGPLYSYEFHIGTSATTAKHRIVYNPTSGDLFVDADGSGPEAAVRFARLPTGLALTYQDFVIHSGSAL